MTAILFPALLLFANFSFEGIAKTAITTVQAEGSQLTGGELSRSIKGLASSKREIRDHSRERLLNRAKVSTVSRASVIRAVLGVLDDPNARFDTWAAAAQVLGELKATEAIDSLIRHLERNDGIVGFSSIHFPAFRAVLNIGPPAIPKLAKALSDGAPSIRQLAAQALGVIGGNEAKNALGQTLEVEKDGDVIRSIQIALSDIQRK